VSWQDESDEPVAAFHLPSAFSKSERHDVTAWTYVLAASEFFDDASGVHPVEPEEPGELPFSDLGAYVELGREVTISRGKQNLIRSGAGPAEQMLCLG